MPAKEQLFPNPKPSDCSASFSFACRRILPLALDFFALSSLNDAFSDLTDCEFYTLNMAALDFALDLMRRLPPSNVEDNLAKLCDLVPDLIEDLLSSIDQPLKIAHDNETRRDYLLCDYNRDGDSYRFVENWSVCCILGGSGSPHLCNPIFFGPYFAWHSH